MKIHEYFMLAQGSLGSFISLMRHGLILLYSNHISAGIYLIVSYTDDVDGQKSQTNMINALKGQLARVEEFICYSFDIFVMHMQ